MSEHKSPAQVLRKKLEKIRSSDWDEEYKARKETEAFNVFGKAVMDELTDAVNWASEKKVAKGLSNGLLFEHRTLQQGLFRALHMMFVNYAEAGKLSKDARNEGAVQLAQKWAETEGFLPLI
jgi:predicted ATP-dependent endonuclease of OLD family